MLSHIIKLFSCLLDSWLFFAVPAIAYGLMAFLIYVNDQDYSDPLGAILWDKVTSNPFTMMAAGGSLFFIYREAIKKNVDGVLFSESLNPSSIYFHAATCVVASLGMVVLEFVYGNFAIQLGMVKWITPVCMCVTPCCFPIFTSLRVILI